MMQIGEKCVVYENNVSFSMDYVDTYLSLVFCIVYLLD